MLINEDIQEYFGISLLQNRNDITYIEHAYFRLGYNNIDNKMT